MLVTGGGLFFGLPALGGGASLIMMSRGFATVGDADPAQKAHILAENISTSINCAIAGVALGVVVGLPLALFGLVGMLRKDPGA